MACSLLLLRKKERYWYISCSLAGSLPSPENVTINSQNSATTQLQWKPPYYTLNQESAVIHVDSHITNYTVYTMDDFNHTVIDSVNVTETSFTPTNVLLCLMYRVSAWNSGGESELSEPVQESRPQGKELTNNKFFKQLFFAIFSLLYL